MCVLARSIPIFDGNNCSRDVRAAAHERRRSKCTAKRGNAGRFRWVGTSSTTYLLHPFLSHARVLRADGRRQYAFVEIYPLASFPSAGSNKLALVEGWCLSGYIMLCRGQDGVAGASPAYVRIWQRRSGRHHRYQL